MPIKLPAFEVDCFSYAPCVSWEDGTKKYHFWLTEKGKPKDDTLHVNEPDHTGNNVHKSLNQRAKRWKPLIDAIMAKIKEDGLLEKARVAEAKRKADEEAARTESYEACLLNAFNVALNVNGGGIDASYVTERERIEFSKMLINKFNELRRG